MATPAASDETPVLYVPEWFTSPRPTGASRSVVVRQHGEREPRRDRLGVDGDVAVDAEPTLGAGQAEPEPRDHLVDHQQRAVLEHTTP